MNMYSVSQLWAVINISIFENTAENKNCFLCLTSQCFTGPREQFLFNSNFVRILLKRTLPEPLLFHGDVVDTSMFRRSFLQYRNLKHNRRDLVTFLYKRATKNKVHYCGMQVISWKTFIPRSFININIVHSESFPCYVFQICSVCFI